MFMLLSPPSFGGQLSLIRYSLLLSLESDSDVYAFVCEVVLQFSYLYLSEMEHACRQHGVCLAYGCSFFEMLHSACSSAGYDRYGKAVSQLCESFAGESLFHAVVVHACKENLSCAAVFRFACPVHQSQVYALASSLCVAVPSVLVVACVDGTDTYL